MGDPTAFICKRLRHTQHQSESKRGQHTRSRDEDLEKTLRKGIAWLNDQGCFEERIRYEDVAEAADGLPEQEVIEVLDNLMDVSERDTIKKPTAWICKGLAGRRYHLEAGR